MKDSAMYIASVRSEKDNYKIALACANQNPKRMIIGIFGGINSLGLKAKKIERSQNIHVNGNCCITADGLIVLFLFVKMNFSSVIEGSLILEGLGVI